MATYNSVFLNALENNDGTAHILTGVNAGGGSVGVGNTGGVIYLYNGTPPTDIDAALDITSGSTTCTLLATVLANVGSNYGVTFDTVSGGVLPKKASETWGTGTIGTFQGQLHASSSAVCTFMRFCKLPDDGHTLNTTSPRIQMTVGQIGSSTLQDIMLVNSTITVGSTFGFTGFQFS